MKFININKTKTEMNNTPRPFVVVDGRRYVLADEEDKDYFASLPEPEIFQKLTPPPRKVSIAAQLLLLGDMSVDVVIGWIFACFGMIFCILIVPLAMNATAELLRYYQPLGQGEITVIEKTGMKVNETPIYLFTFKQPNGTVGKCRFFGEQYKIGDNVDLEKCGYRVRIVGSGKNLNFVETLLLLVLLFPIVGLLIFGYKIFRSLKTLRLLRDGEIGKGYFIEMKPTGMVINTKPEMKLHYQFTANDGEIYNAFAKTCDTKKLTDDSFEPLFYDVMKPDKSVLLDSLPNGIRFDEFDGTFRANPLRIFLPTLLCGLFLAELVTLIYAIAIGGLI
jgi:hypothetical protein